MRWCDFGVRMRVVIPGMGAHGGQGDPFEGGVEVIREGRHSRSGSRHSASTSKGMDARDVHAQEQKTHVESVCTAERLAGEARGRRLTGEPPACTRHTFPLPRGLAIA